GAKEREIQLMLDQAKLDEYGVSPQAIIETLNSSNQSSSVGTIEKGNQDLQLRVIGVFDSLADFIQSNIQIETDATIHAEDVAEIKDTFKETSSETLVNEEPSIVLSVMKKTDGNTVDVAENIKDSIATLKGDLPDDVNLDVVIDTSEFIQM